MAEENAREEVSGVAYAAERGAIGSEWGPMPLGGVPYYAAERGPMPLSGVSYSAEQLAICR